MFRDIFLKSNTLFLLLVIVILINCSGPGVSGATSETTNGQVSSVAINEDGYAVTNASVFIYKKDELRSINDTDISAVTKTGDNGSFTISDLDTFDYNIEIVDSFGNRAKVIASYDTITGLHEISGVGQVQLRKAGRLYGTVDHSPFEKVYVQIYGLHRIVEVDSSGYFLFSDLPHGEVLIKIMTDTGFVVEEQDSFNVKTSESTNCGLYSTDNSLEIETAIIRNFLDVNGLTNIEVSEIGKGSSRHYYEIYCDSMDIDSITPDLSQLRLKSLSLGYTKISNIPPEIGSMATLHYLDISGNQLTSLPETIGSLESLETLDMGYNYIDRLPEAILNLENIKYLYINGNRLHDIPIHIRNWIDKYTLDPYWEISQR